MLDVFQLAQNEKEWRTFQKIAGCVAVMNEATFWIHSFGKNTFLFGNIANSIPFFLLCIRQSRQKRKKGIYNNYVILLASVSLLNYLFW